MLLVRDGRVIGEAKISQRKNRRKTIHPKKREENMKEVNRPGKQCWR